MIKKIRLPGLKAETLIGFLATIGALRLIVKTTPTAKLAWAESGSGWIAEFHVPNGKFVDANAVAEEVFEVISKNRGSHPILSWCKFLEKQFTDERDFFRTAAEEFLAGNQEDFVAVFTTQLPVTQGDSVEHFDHPFRGCPQGLLLGKSEHCFEEYDTRSRYPNGCATVGLSGCNG